MLDQGFVGIIFSVFSEDKSSKVLFYDFWCVSDLTSNILLRITFILNNLLFCMFLGARNSSNMLSVYENWFTSREKGHWFVYCAYPNGLYSMPSGMPFFMELPQKFI
jgi:hypothetical protein